MRMKVPKVYGSILGILLVGGLVALGAESRAYADSGRVKAVFKSLTLEEKVGQMLMFGFPYTDAKAAGTLVAKYHLGGIILFKPNAVGAGQLKALTSGVQKVAKSDTGVPLLISTDEEGGKVQRLDGVTGKPLKGNSEWGYLYSSDKAGAREGVEAQGKTVAGNFKEYGLNMNLAPVLDVVTVKGNEVIGSRGRSYGSDPDTVGDLGSRYIKALQGSGVAATAKHFPGHGAATVDSHLDKPKVELTRDELLKTHVAPFKAAVEAGVDAVMTAHILYPAVDPVNPATMSGKWITDILRGDLGFKGVVITDGMLMGAVEKGYTVDESVLDSVGAGADILLFDHGTKAQATAYGTLLKAVRTKRISQERIDESVLRILTLKDKLGLL